jgi:hypothetical protein
MTAAPVKKHSHRAGKYDLHTSVGVSGHLGRTAAPENQPQSTRHVSKDFFWFLYVRYSTLSHLPPLSCVGGCWDRTQDCCYFGIDSQTL